MSVGDMNGQKSAMNKKITMKELKAQIKLNGCLPSNKNSTGIYSSIVKKSSDLLLDLSVNNFSNSICMAKVIEECKKNPSPSKRDKIIKDVKSPPEKILRKSPRKINQVPNLDKILQIGEPPEHIQTSKMVENWLDTSQPEANIEQTLIEEEYDGNPEFIGSSQEPSASTENVLSPMKKICTESVREMCTIRVKCDDVMYRFRLKMDEKFDSLFKQLAQELKINSSQIMLSRKTNDVKEGDTAESLNLGFAEILDCYVQSSVGAVPESDSNTITLKFQSQDRRETMTLMVNPDDSFSLIKEKYAETKNLDAEKVVFLFDGDKIENEQTPNELELENDFCIDVCLKV